jgi:restriction system protein
MPIPDFQSIFKPFLDIASDGQEHSLKEARERIAEHFKLSKTDLEELLPSGTQKKFDNRVAWAKSYFVQAKVLESPKRAHFRITEKGKDLLAQGHERIDVKILKQYPEFVEFHTGTKTSTQSEPDLPEETPEEILQTAYKDSNYSALSIIG